MYEQRIRYKRVTNSLIKETTIKVGQADVTNL